MVYFASGTKAGQHADIISSSIVDPTTIGSSFVSVVPNVVKRESKETQFIAVSTKKKKEHFSLFGVRRGGWGILMKRTNGIFNLRKTPTEVLIMRNYMRLWFKESQGNWLQIG